MSPFDHPGAVFDRSNTVADGGLFPTNAASELQERGFVVIPGPVPPNTSSAPRRSLQGFFIPRDGRAGTDFGARMHPDTRARLSPLAHYVLAL